MAWSHAPRAFASPRGYDDNTRLISVGPREGTWVRGTSHLPNLRHRGDWERADALVLVHHWEWAEHISRLARLAAHWVNVLVLVQGDDSDPPQFSPRAGDHGRVRVMHQGTDSPWIRDYGPVQVFDQGHPRWLDFAYADDRWRDDRVPSALASHFEMPLQAEQQRFDGGGIASNGRGVCAVTDDSLDVAGLAAGDPMRSVFAARLGCKVMAVLPALPEETTGHVDVFVQFFGPDVVGVGQMRESGTEAQVAALDTAVRTLTRAAASIGQPLRVVRVPIVAHGETFFSYINGLPVGGAFFMPTYAKVGSATQTHARQQLRLAMPGRRIVAVRADEMVEYGGALHCLTDGLSLRRVRVPTPMSPRVLAWLTGRWL